MHIHRQVGTARYDTLEESNRHETRRVCILGSVVQVNLDSRF